MINDQFGNSILCSTNYIWASPISTKACFFHCYFWACSTCTAVRVWCVITKSVTGLWLVKLLGISSWRSLRWISSTKAAYLCSRKTRLAELYHTRTYIKLDQIKSNQIQLNSIRIDLVKSNKINWQKKIRLPSQFFLWALTSSLECSWHHSTILMCAPGYSWAHMSAYGSSWQVMSVELF